MTQQPEQKGESLLDHPLPYEFYGRARECPMFWDPKLQGYLVTRYGDVEEVMSNHDVYHLHSETDTQYSDNQTEERVSTFRTLLSAKTLSPVLDSLIRAEINRVVDRFAKNGRVELWSELADRFPGHIIGLLFGLGEDDFDDILAYRDARVAVFQSPPDQAAEAARVAQEWQEKVSARLVEAIADHRANPREDLLTEVLGMEENGQPIPDDQIIQLVVRDLLVAGSETVTHALCNIIHELLSRPELLAEVSADFGLIPKIVDEGLRLEPPVLVFWRSAVQDSELDGCPVATGTQLYPALGAANRDPVKFPHPDDFSLDRPGGQHLTFGVGLHRCPGAWLGRTELEEALKILLTRLPRLRFDPDAEPAQYAGAVIRSWRPLHLLFDV